MSEDYLRRYIHLTALMYLLHKREITLLDPASWDDKEVDIKNEDLASLADVNFFTATLAKCQGEAQNCIGDAAAGTTSRRTASSGE